MRWLQCYTNTSIGSAISPVIVDEPTLTYVLNNKVFRPIKEIYTPPDGIVKLRTYAYVQGNDVNNHVLDLQYNFTRELVNALNNATYYKYVRFINYENYDGSPQK